MTAVPAVLSSCALTDMRMLQADPMNTRPNQLQSNRAGDELQLKSHHVGDELQTLVRCGDDDIALFSEDDSEGYFTLSWRLQGGLSSHQQVVKDAVDLLQGVISEESATPLEIHVEWLVGRIFREAQFSRDADLSTSLTTQIVRNGPVDWKSSDHVLLRTEGKKELVVEWAFKDSQPYEVFFTARLQWKTDPSVHQFLTYYFRRFHENPTVRNNDKITSHLLQSLF